MKVDERSSSNVDHNDGDGFRQICYTRARLRRKCSGMMSYYRYVQVSKDHGT